MASLLSGKDLAATIKASVAERAAKLRSQNVIPTLAIVVATDDESTAWYVRSIAKAGEKVGIAVRTVTLDSNTDTEAVVAVLSELASDPLIHGIIVQTPLPDEVSLAEVAAVIPPGKDVDGVNPLSLGRLVLGEPAFAPATATAVMELLRHHGVALSGHRAVVVGRSAVVGKPVAYLLLAENATVTICHSKTADLASVTKQADVLVVAIGRARMITSEYVGDGAIVIDVGTNTDEAGQLVGDVDETSVTGVAGALTPVPGGVGPVTTALLLRNAVTAAERL